MFIRFLGVSAMLVIVGGCNTAAVPGGWVPGVPADPRDPRDPYDPRSPYDPKDSTPARQQLVAVGDEGTILTSTDGYDWFEESSRVDEDLTSIATGRSLFVAVGKAGTILTSRDAITWTRRDSRTDVDLEDVIYTGENFVAVGGDQDSGAVALKSWDGVTWTELDAPSRYTFHAVTHGAGTLVAAARNRNDQDDRSLFTADVSSGSGSDVWSRRQGPDFEDSLHNGDLTMVVGGHRASTSRNGLDWNRRELPSDRKAKAVGYGNYTFVVVGEKGAIFTSRDGDQWDERQSVLSGGNGNGNDNEQELRGVAYGRTGFAAVGRYGKIVTSTDGRNWTREVSGSKEDLVDVVYGPALR